MPIRYTKQILKRGPVRTSCWAGGWIRSGKVMLSSIRLKYETTSTAVMLIHLHWYMQTLQVPSFEFPKRKENSSNERLLDYLKTVLAKSLCVAYSFVFCPILLTSNNHQSFDKSKRSKLESMRDVTRMLKQAMTSRECSSEQMIF